MKKLSIILSKDTIFNDAERRTAYIGAKDAAEGAFEHYALTDIDKQEMDTYWDYAESLLSTSFGEWLLSHTHNEDTCEFVLNVADNIGANAQTEIEACARVFMVDTILGRWCSVVAPDRVQFYDNEATVDLKNIQTALLNRQRPTR